jgi:hypothetical protein
MRALAVLAPLVAIAATSVSPAHGAEPGSEATALVPGATQDDEASWQPGVRDATRYANRRRGSVSFAIIDLEGQIDGFGAHRTAPAASVFKAMLLVTYLRQARHRTLSEDDRSLLGPMIRRSDNEAATRVDDIVGRRAINRLARDAQMRDFDYHRTVWGLTRTSARDQALFFYKLERYVPDRHDAYARRLLASIVRSQRWGVARVRPDGWELFFKGGWGSATGRVNHQAAFLERHQHRVALAILTEFSPRHAYGKETLKGVARRLLRGLPALPPAG